MRFHLFWSVLTIFALIIGKGATAGPTLPAERVRINADYQLSGPYTCRNLSIFLVHRENTVKGKRMISLADALERKMVTVDETGAVNRPTARNTSDEV